MAYTFIIGSNPLRPTEERKEYIICIRPHFALISIDTSRVKHLQVDRLHAGVGNKINRPYDMFDLEAKVLKAAAHWYKKVREGRGTV